MRKFGLEFEFLCRDPKKIVDELNLSCIPTNEEGYNHCTRNYWKLTTDGSVQPIVGIGPVGRELVSPILDSVDKIDTVLSVLRKYGSVNSTCGFHVHIDARDFGVEDFYSCLLHYAHFENEIDSWFPRNRRGNVNRYCGSVKGHSEFLREKLIVDFRLNTWKPLETYLNPSRYMKLNISAYNRHGTIEFRQHAGTFSTEKVLHWIKFCQEFVTNCKISEEDAHSRDHDMFIRYLSDTLSGTGIVSLQKMLNTIAIQLPGWLDPFNPRVDLVKKIKKLNQQLSDGKIKFVNIKGEIQLKSSMSMPLRSLSIKNSKLDITKLFPSPFPAKNINEIITSTDVMQHLSERAVDLL